MILETVDILRIYEFYQKCRYATKTQISLGPKKYRYAGETKSLELQKNATISSVPAVQPNFSRLPHIVITFYDMTAFIPMILRSPIRFRTFFARQGCSSFGSG